MNLLKGYAGAIDRRRKEDSAYHWLGLSPYRLGHKEQALEALRAGVVLAAGAVSVRLDLGNVLKLEGACVAAACEYARALELPDRAALIEETRRRLSSLPVGDEEPPDCGRWSWRRASDTR